MRTLCGHIYPATSQLNLKNLKKDKKKLLMTFLYTTLDPSAYFLKNMKIYEVKLCV